MKITVNKKVFWDAGSRVMEGKVKQVVGDHAIITAEGCEYIVMKSALRQQPMLKSASMTIISKSRTS